MSEKLLKRMIYCFNSFRTSHFVCNAELTYERNPIEGSVFTKHALLSIHHLMSSEHMLVYYCLYDKDDTIKMYIYKLFKHLKI